ncbi:hypothetical protein BDR06DRAFT_958384 [Suillus hirtellus]|nr:hypothetical protein BDR06DRAFT_958384 [Suillus hirtellus]
MIVLNISKLGFYVLLLSVAFTQILVASAAENDNLDSDDAGVIGEWVPAIMWSRIDGFLEAIYPY